MKQIIVFNQEELDKISTEDEDITIYINNSNRNFNITKKYKNPVYIYRAHFISTYNDSEIVCLDPKTVILADGFSKVYAKCAYEIHA